MPSTHSKERIVKAWIRYDIYCTFGSKFQKDSADEALRAMIGAWFDFYRKTHKKNFITVERHEEPINPVIHLPAPRRPARKATKKK